nr:reverse transcriptase domain-containing protein [Tanacetum cinerariifolium]GFA59203.1 reverse transcriptase domain-containing protein [Tanacetum cinerariifolium]
MAPKRKSTSTAPAMTQAAIRKLVTDSVAVALEAQVATMANTDNTNRNPRESETLVARKCSYKEFISCNPFYFKGTEGVLALSASLNELNRYFSSTIKENDLKTYVRRFQKLAVLCLTMVPNAEKLMEVFNEGLPRSIEGNVTASKPQTLEEATTIAQRLMDQCSKANNSARGRAYVLRNKNAHQTPNVVTGTFLLNQHLARVLFDSGADKSFVVISLASKRNIPPITLDTTYDIEMADRNLVGTNTQGYK